MRAFLAILLDERVRAALSRIARPPVPPRARVRWVDARNLHLTLKFLGEVAEAALPAVTRALAGASGMVEPFRLRVAGLGAFPPRGAPRVLFAGAAGGAALPALAAALDEALACEGFPPEDRPFHAHVTLARIQGRLAQNWLAGEQAASGDQPDFGVQEVREVTLMKSLLLPGGAVHEAVQAFPLARRPSCGGG